jgi:DNA (cytosine-5)-methyltransferase 1
MITIGTDCSGIEAPIAALRQLKIPHRHLWSCEIDKFARKSIEANYTPETIFEDITKRDHSKLPDVDIYVCGFPCQPFSLAGRLEGLKDKRSNIMFECIKVIKAKQPKIFILENVKNFTSVENGNVFAFLMKKLKALNRYSISHCILNTKNYGIPQNRERLFIIGIRSDLQHKPFPIPPTIKMQPLRKFIDYKDSNDTHSLNARAVRTLMRFQHKKLSDLDGNYIIATTSFMYAMKNISPTITTRDDHYIVLLNRRMSPREYLNLQGFSKSFKIVVSKSQIVKQAGNSMSVCVLVAIIKQLQACTNVL